MSSRISSLSTGIPPSAPKKHFPIHRNHFQHQKDENVLKELGNNLLNDLKFQERLKAFLSFTNLKAGWQAAQHKNLKIRENETKLIRYLGYLGLLWDIVTCLEKVIFVIIFGRSYLNLNSKISYAFVKGVYRSHMERTGHPIPGVYIRKPYSSTRTT